jgi:hypothetical protein
MAFSSKNSSAKHSAPAMMGQIAGPVPANDRFAQVPGCLMAQMINNHLSMEMPWRNITY